MIYWFETKHYHQFRRNRFLKEKSIKKSQHLTKHGVENRVAMATNDIIDKNFPKIFQ